MSNIFNQADFDTEIFDENKNDKKYRSTKHIKKWLILFFGFLIVFILSAALVPEDRVENPTNEFSFVLMIGFIGFVVALDHLISGWVYFKRGEVK